MGLIKKEKIQNINTKILYNNYKQYEKDIDNINNLNNSENNLKPDNNINNNQINLKLDDNINDNQNIIIIYEIYNKEHLKCVKELELGYKKIKLYQKVDDAIEDMKSIIFEDTKIIICGRLFSEFINKFKENIKDIYFAPKIIIFTNEEKNFLEYSICNRFVQPPLKRKK